MSATVDIGADNSDEWRAKFKEALKRGLVAVGEDGASIASDNAPFDTGRLAGSITYALTDDDTAVIIGTNVEYAPYQELGTSMFKGHPYLRPMLRNNSERFKALIENFLRQG